MAIKLNYKRAEGRLPKQTVPDLVKVGRRLKNNLHNNTSDKNTHYPTAKEFPATQKHSLLLPVLEKDKFCKNAIGWEQD